MSDQKKSSRPIARQIDEGLLQSIAAGLHVPKRIVLPASWIGHIPFASWIVAVQKPRIVVELGVHTGNSFFTFAEAAQRSRLPTRLYGIDTWSGDDHAGAYAEDVFVDVSAIARSQFPESVELVRKLFDDAVTDFEDGSIDLLHIDGLHTYEAVRHDFETWRPKLSSRAVVLFHDIAVQQEGFGVDRFWREVSQTHPHLAFTHSNGLGVLLVGSDVPAEVAIHARPSVARDGLVLLLTKLGRFLADAVKHGPDVDALPINAITDLPRIYVAAGGSFDEAEAMDARPRADAAGWLECAIAPVPNGATMTLRIDPMNEVGIRGVRRVLVLSQHDDASIELVPSPTDPCERLTIVPVDGGYLFVATEHDSQWFPELTTEARALFAAGARIGFEPIAAPTASLSRLLLKSLRTLVAPLEERLLDLRTRRGELDAHPVVQLTAAVANLESRLVEADRDLLVTRTSLAAFETRCADAEHRHEATSAELAAARSRFDEERVAWGRNHEALVVEFAASRSQFEEERAGWARNSEALVAELAAARSLFDEERVAWSRNNEALVAELAASRAHFDEERAAWSQSHRALDAELVASKSLLEGEREAWVREREALGEVHAALEAAVKVRIAESDALRGRIAARADRDHEVGQLLAVVRSDWASAARPATDAVTRAVGALIKSDDANTSAIGGLVRSLLDSGQLIQGRLVVQQRRQSMEVLARKKSPPSPGDERTMWLEPGGGLQALDEGGQRWRGTNDDPQFAFDELRDYAGSWISLTIALTAEEQPAGNPVIYMDRGDGMSEDSAIILPRSRVTADLLPYVFYVPRDLQRARFDPCSAPIAFTFAGARIRVLSKWQAMFSMAKAMRRSGRLRHLKNVYLPKWHSMRRSEVRSQVMRDLVEGYNATLQTHTPNYQGWISRFELDPGLYRLLAAKRSHWIRQPVISVVMPTYETPAALLREAIDSVIAQDYPHWQLCIADDASSAPHVASILNEYRARDDRIKVVFRKTNGHIAAASNSALELASGEFVALLDHDDRLHPLALHYVAEAIIGHPEAKLIFSDEDKLDAQGQRHTPYFKCDFNPELFLAQNMVTHLGCYETATVRSLGGFRVEVNGAQDWDLALRVFEQVGSGGIFHIPRVLYHWRELPGSTSVSISEKPYAEFTGRRAVEEHLARQNVSATVEPAPLRPAWNRIRYAVPDPQPKVSIVIPTRDKVEVLRTAVDSVLERTTYRNLEIVIVDNGSVEPETHAYFDTLPADRVRIVRDDSPFNYSRINNDAVRQTSGELICLLNNDIEVINADWLEEMVSIVCQPTVGIVGARLWYPDHRIQHAGVIVGLGGVAGHAHKFLPQDSVGYFGRAALQQQLTAVTAACLVIRRSVWDAVGGLDESLQIAFNDVDLCLRVGALGHRIVWTPFAELIHYESASRGAEDTPEKIIRFQAEQTLMRNRWGETLRRDPFYSPNLTLAAEDFSISWEPRLP